MSDLYLPLEERRRLLRSYGQEYGLRVFVETGTHLGETPWVLRDDFDTLYTIELSRELYAAAVNRFRSFPKVHCIFGDSAEKLAEVLQEVDQPVLAWLDGHHSGPGTAYSVTPVAKELVALLEDGRPHVILVDDARCFAGQPEHESYPHYADYPSVEWVEELAQSYGYSFEFSHDILRLVP